MEHRKHIRIGPIQPLWLLPLALIAFLVVSLNTHTSNIALPALAQQEGPKQSWSEVCGDYRVEIIGRSFKGLDRQTITLPEDFLWATLQAGGAGYNKLPPEEVRFEFDDGSVLSQTTPTRYLGPGSIKPDGMMGYTFEVAGEPGQTLVAVQEVNPGEAGKTTEGLVGYFGMPLDPGDEIHTFVGGTTLQYTWGGWTEEDYTGPGILELTFPNPMLETADIEITSVVMEKDPQTETDDRVAVLTVSAQAGGVEEQSEIIFDPDPGINQLNIITLTLQDVPAGTDTVVIELDSPPPSDPDLPNGDSVFLVGANAQHPCMRQQQEEPEVDSFKSDTLLIDNNGDGQANPGDTLRYTIETSNVSSVDATEVTFSDTPDANTTLVAGSVTTTQGTVTQGNTTGDTSVGVDIGTLGVEETVTITFDVIINSPFPADVTEVANQGLIESPDIPDTPTDDPDTPEPDDPTITPVFVPELDSFKSDTLFIDNNGDGLANPGDTLRYTIELNSIGNGNATDVTFSDTPDANTTLVAGSVASTQGTVTQGNTAGDTSVGVDIGFMEPESTVTITFDVTINSPLPEGVTEVANQGFFESPDTPEVPTDDPDTPDPDDPTITPVFSPQIDAFKSDTLFIDENGDGLANPGDTLQYTIEVSSIGRGSATNVVFSDTPDPRTTLVAGSVTTTQGTVTEGNTAGDTSVGIEIGTLEEEVTVTITFEVTINNPLPEGVTEVVNQGLFESPDTPDTPTDDPDTPEPDDPTRTPIVSPNVDSFKSDALSIDDNNDGLASPGDRVRYTITVVNNGTSPATEVVFTDTPDPRTTLVAGSVTTTKGTVTQGNTAGDTSIAIDIGTLGVEETVTITFEVEVTGLSDNPNSEPDLANQGFFNSPDIPEVPTDDPDTPEPDDPTLTPVGDEEPKAIDLLSFTAAYQGGDVVVNWETGLEIDTLGFHILRSTDGTLANAERVTTSLIVGEGSPSSGATYSWVDTNTTADTTYTYWLEETEIGGKVNYYGSTSVTTTISNDGSDGMKRIYLPISIR